MTRTRGTLHPTTPPLDAPSRTQKVYATVARQLGLTRQHVRYVALGQRKSPDGSVERAIAAELKRRGIRSIT